MFMYCEKCGYIKNQKDADVVCDVCDSSMLTVPQEYLTDSGFMFKTQKKREEFEEFIKQNSNYDTDVAMKREEIIEERKRLKSESVAEKVKEYNETRIKFTCPICHSEMLEKISNVGKVVKVGVFGILGAGDIGKKYRCKSCGYRF